MPFNVPVLDLDITGLNPNNRIPDEPHTLSNRPVRSIATNLGPFFGESVVVKNGASTLSRGSDYQIVELHQEATLRYGKEIASVILIINSNIPSDVTVTYQALGGHYTYNDNAIGNMYQSVMNDNRPVDWTNIFNKPTEFNASVHRHLLEDVYGFEPIVDYLERIKRAITLGQTTVVLEIVNSLLSKFKCGELPKCLPSNKLIQYDAMLYFLSRRKILNNIWVDKKDCVWYKGDSAVVQIDTSGYPIGTTLFWELYKPEMNIGTFGAKSGSFKTNGTIKEIQIYVPADTGTVEYPLYLGVKESPVDADYKAVTYLIDIREHICTDYIYPYLLSNALEFNDTNAILAMIADDDERRLYYTLSNY